MWLVNCIYNPQNQTLHPEYKTKEYISQSGETINDAPFKPVSKVYSGKEACYCETNTCTGLCGNYRRVVWPTSRHVGCYRHQCEPSDIWTTPRYVIACHYKPAGRNPNVSPYINKSSRSGYSHGLGFYRKQCTEMTTTGAVLYATEHSDDAVAIEFLETIEQPIETHMRISATKMPFIQTQIRFSPTKTSLTTSDKHNKESVN
uniref:SCP domain-containing protein n=1 Tax=Mesocestoides corti TaxID=53468 RepID=A0A5K3G2E9_MESCO